MVVAVAVLVVVVGAAVVNEFRILFADIFFSLYTISYWSFWASSFVDGAPVNVVVRSTKISNGNFDMLWRYNGGNCVIGGDIVNVCARL